MYSNLLNLGYNDTQCYLPRKCGAGQGYRPDDEEKQCGFDYGSLGPCAPKNESGFGYNDNAPCLYLRLSKVSDNSMQEK